MEKGESPEAVLGMQVGTATSENSVEVFKKLKIELPYDPAIALLGIYPKDTDIVQRRAICTPMFIDKQHCPQELTCGRSRDALQ